MMRKIAGLAVAAIGLTLSVSGCANESAQQPSEAGSDAPSPAGSPAVSPSDEPSAAEAVRTLPFVSPCKAVQKAGSDEITALVGRWGMIVLKPGDEGPGGIPTQSHTCTFNGPTGDEFFLGLSAVPQTEESFVGLLADVPACKPGDAPAVAGATAAMSNSCTSHGRVELITGALFGNAVVSCTANLPRKQASAEVAADTLALCVDLFGEVTEAG